MIKTNMTGNQHKEPLDAAYMELLSGPTSKSDGFLTYDSFELGDFDPEKLMEHLIKCAILNDREPDQFHRDMLFLISKKQNAECPFKSRMENRYDITTFCTGSDSITVDRLCVMFSHFNFVDRDGLASSSFDKLIQQPEFAGLIPKRNQKYLYIDNSVYDDLILLHLHGLRHSRPLMSTSELFKQFMWRHQKSLLSNERRVKFLRNIGVLASKMEHGYRGCESIVLGSNMQVIREKISSWSRSKEYMDFQYTLNREKY